MQRILKQVCDMHCPYLRMSASMSPALRAARMAASSLGRSARALLPSTAFCSASAVRSTSCWCLMAWSTGCSSCSPSEWAPVACWLAALATASARCTAA